MPEVILPSPPPIPIRLTNTSDPVLSAEGILVKDIGSNIILYSKNENEKLAPASTTKIITALVALEHYKLDDILTVQTVITEGKTMGLVKDEQLTAESLLYGALVHSANDAAYTIAENYPGGVTEFVAAMNRKAASIGLSSTSFQNPIGFDDPGQYTTATELARLAMSALKNKIFTKIVGTKSITVSDINFSHFHELKNVNELLGKIPGVSGVKTGYTENAGEILVTEVRKNDKDLLIVLLKSNDRFGETAKLIDWVFQHFKWTEVNSITPTTLR